MTESPEPSYTLALEEARRGLDQLAGEVSAVRDRAVTTLGMGGLAASVVGGLSIRSDETVTDWIWVAAVAFVALAAICVTVAWPRRFPVSRDPAELVLGVEHQRVSLRKMERDLALWLGERYDDHRDRADDLGRLQSLASVVFLVEVGALILDLLSR